MRTPHPSAASVSIRPWRNKPKWSPPNEPPFFTGGIREEERTTVREKIMTQKKRIV